jgi:shikimate dehydrogenase
VKVAAVLGHPVAHSKSPALHNAAYRALGLDATYLALDVAPGDLARALGGVAALGFMGVNVTVPHKEAALAACDEVDAVARLCQAVNTVVVGEGGRLLGHNTDVEGFRRSVEEVLGRVPARAAVLGAGGAARAVTLALVQAGAAVRVVARNLERGRRLHDLGAAEVVPWRPESLEPVELLVDATSIGLSAAEEAAAPPPPLDALPDSALVVSLVYHREPALLAAARARGLRTLDGAGMLIHQAALAFRLMTGRDAPLEVMRAAFQTVH